MTRFTLGPGVPLLVELYFLDAMPPTRASKVREALPETAKVVGLLYTTHTICIVLSNHLHRLEDASVHTIPNQCAKRHIHAFV